MSQGPPSRAAPSTAVRTCGGSRRADRQSRDRRLSLPLALLSVLCLNGCFGAAGAAEESTRLPVRVLDGRGLEWPRDAANDLQYALAAVPGAIFGVADRTTLQQVAANQAQLELDLPTLTEWAAKAARPWVASDGVAVTVMPAETRVTRVMIAAFQPDGGSNYGVGFHDLGLRRNLVLIYVDRACEIESADDGSAASVRYGLALPGAGFYWVRTAPGETIEGIDPESLSIELRPRSG